LEPPATTAAAHDNPIQDPQHQEEAFFTNKAFHANTPLYLRKRKLARPMEPKDTEEKQKTGGQRMQNRSRGAAIGDAWDEE